MKQVAKTASGLVIWARTIFIIDPHFERLIFARSFLLEYPEGSDTQDHLEQLDTILAAWI